MFLRSSMNVGMTPPIEYLPGKADENIVLGEALELKSGALTKCGTTAKPEYIAVGNVQEGNVPVIKVQDYVLFETVLTADGTSLAIGDKVTLSADGLGVTATTESGVAAIVAMHGKEKDAFVTVRF